MLCKWRKNLVKKIKATTLGKKAVMTNEDLQAYLEGDFKQSVIDFNNRCGKGVTDQHSCTQVLQLVINQNKVVIEECLESLTAFQERNTTERLDGLIDVYVTKTMLDEFMNALDKFSDEEITEASLNFSEDDLLTLQIVPQLLNPALIAAQGINLFTSKRFYINAELILENNRMKYTDDYDKMLTWKDSMKESSQIKTTTIDGKDWYCIILTETGKIQKPFDFVPVTLDLH